MIVKYIKPAVWSCLLAVLFTGCSFSEKANVQSVYGYSMGTSYSIKVVASLNEAQNLQIGIEGVLSDINQRMSTYLARSDIALFSEQPVGEPLTVDLKTGQVVDAALRIARQTDGAFDPTIAPLVNLWGFGPTPQQSALPSDESIAAELQRVGFEAVSVNLEERWISKTADRELDLSAIAKGYAVDEMARYLNDKGFDSYLVEVGGEMRFSGQKPDGGLWRIAIEKPDPEIRTPFRLLELTDLAIATSGDYRNYMEVDGQRYSHTIDPKTGYPIDHELASVTVVMDSCMEADAYATAFNVMGREKTLQLAEELSIAVYLIYRQDGDFRTQQSTEFTELFGDDQVTAL